jgi:peptidoglycan hydrolase CwlO-like protein
MKNFQQNLLIVLALALCVLCACQWYRQTLEHVQTASLARLVHDKDVAIQDDTNQLANLNHQVDQMDARLTELKDTVKTNEEIVLAQKRDISRLQFTGAVLTNQIAEYTNAVATLEGRLKDAYDGVKKQNDAIQTLTAQRDEFVQKLNDSVKERNDIVAKYNELAAQYEKLQTNR